MTLRPLIPSLTGIAALLLWLVPAHAQPHPAPPTSEPTRPRPTPQPAEPTPNEPVAEPVPADSGVPPLITPLGMAVSVGGGIIGFLDDDAREVTDTGGSWEARFIIGTRKMLAAEVAYTGAGHWLEALGLSRNALLISTGIEGLARFNILTNQWQPYLVAGIGWRRYDVTNSGFNNSAVSDSDDLLEIPFGGGVAFRSRGVILDMRLLFRAAADSDLIDATQTGEEGELHTWETSLKVGWEF